MNAPKSLFDPLPPARRGEATQQEAARKVAAHAPGLRARVLDFIRSKGALGATIEEISDGTGIKQSSVCGRISELRDLQQIFHAYLDPCEGEGLYRKTKAGVNAKVWKLWE